MTAPKAYVFVEYPKWMYRRGPGGEIESALFENADSVPEDGGWAASPAALAAGESKNVAENRAAPKGRKPRSKTGPAQG